MRSPSARNTGTQTSAGQPERRKYLITAIYAMGATVATALAVPTVLYLLSPSKARSVGWIEVADIDSLPVAEPVEITFQRSRVDGWNTNEESTTAWVVKKSDKNVFAFAP